MHPDDTVIDICGRKIGGGNFQVIAGPCSIETKEQITEVAEDVKRSGATLLRGGAFKPRTSPYAFQGLHEHGLDLLLEAKKATGLPVVTEIMSAEHLPLFDDVDVIQVGARNMQNFELLKVLGKIDKPILLKRGLANTLDELLMSAEYIMAGGNEKVILCERGIRTFETSYRNTLDISAVPMLKKKTHLPVVIDPSHAAGIRFMVEPLAMAAIAAGADGLMIEVHNNPEKALCDGAQSLTPEKFDHLMKKVNKTVDFFHTLGYADHLSQITGKMPPESRSLRGHSWYFSLVSQHFDLKCKKYIFSCFDPKWKMQEHLQRPYYSGIYKHIAGLRKI